MKHCLMTCVLLLGCCGLTSAAEPGSEKAELREELRELRHLLEIMRTRIDRLEQRIDSRGTATKVLLPWQEEQPYLWDGILRSRSREYRLPSPGDDF